MTSVWLVSVIVSTGILIYGKIIYMQSGCAACWSMFCRFQVFAVWKIEKSDIKNMNYVFNLCFII